MGSRKLIAIFEGDGECGKNSIFGLDRLAGISAELNGSLGPAAAPARNRDKLPEVELTPNRQT